jgi:exocyst complex component 7
MLIDVVPNIFTALETNFDVWSKVYDNATLSYLFMMNTHWHFFKHLKPTKLGDLLSGVLKQLLNRDGLILFSKGRATARDRTTRKMIYDNTP